MIIQRARLFVFLSAFSCYTVTAVSAAEQTQGPIKVDLKNPKGSARVWVQSSLSRIYPKSEPGTSVTLTREAARNQRVSFQVAYRNDSLYPAAVQCITTPTKEMRVQVRRVGYVPMPHLTPNTRIEELEGVEFLPGLVPDPLFPETTATAGPQETQAFWITVDVPTTATPGLYDLPIDLQFSSDKTVVSLKPKINVHAFTIQPRKNFPVTHWWRPSSLWQWYGYEPWSDQWFAMARKYLVDMKEHGSNTVLVNTLEMRRELFRTPNQMLKITKTGDKYNFDYSTVRRFVKMAKEVGMDYYEWPHLWLYWGVDNPMPVYKDPGKTQELFFSTNGGGFDEGYIDFLKQYLDSLHAFLQEEGILEQSYFHLSDEPGGGGHYDRYKKARGILKDIAPWMKVMDALSLLDYGKNGITDIPVPSIHTAKSFHEAGIFHWAYYCCGPTGDYLNRFMDTPLAKIRMSGMLFYHLGASGFLHWGYNYWDVLEKDEPLNPYFHGDAERWPGIPYGDPFVVYPGANGPVDSIRWEIFAESLQDYAMLQSAGIKPDDPLLAPLQDYNQFPKSEGWILKAVEEIMARGAEQQKGQ
jgi:hypothetical protein